MSAAAPTTSTQKAAPRAPAKPRKKSSPKRTFTPPPLIHPLEMAVRQRRRAEIIAAIQDDPEYARAGTERWGLWVALLAMVSSPCLATLLELSPGLEAMEESWWKTMDSTVAPERAAAARTLAREALSRREAAEIGAVISADVAPQEAVARVGARRL